MFVNIATISAICLALAYSGWEPDYASTSPFSSDLTARDGNNLSLWNSELQQARDRPMCDPGTNMYDVEHVRLLGIYDNTSQPERTVHLADDDADDSDVIVNDADDDGDVTVDDSDDGHDVTVDHDIDDDAYVLMDLNLTVNGGFEQTRVLPQTKLWLRVTDYDTDLKTFAVTTTKLYKTTRPDRTDSKHRVFLLRFTVPVLIVIFYIKEKLSKPTELDGSKTAQKVDDREDDKTAVKSGHGDQKRRRKDKPPPVIEIPGRQQVRRGRRRRRCAGKKGVETGKTETHI